MNDSRSLGKNATSKPTIIAIGYSVRALVEACVGRGYSVIAIDHFGDADTLCLTNNRWISLELTSEKELSDKTWGQLVELTAQLIEPAVMLLAGGMENLPLVIAQLETAFELVGPNRLQMQQLRDWQVWKIAANVAALRFPDSAIELPTRAEGEWLWKLNSSAGGLGVSDSCDENSGASGSYWQRFIAGRQLGATCLLDCDQVAVVGATRSFDGDEWFGPTRFVYRGSYGPIPLCREHEEQIFALANYLRVELHVRGWLQFDFIEDSSNQLWFLECNPRWTAGMEILTRAGLPLIDEHLSAARGKIGSASPRCVVDSNCFAKAIVYAPTEFEVTAGMIDQLRAEFQASSTQASWLADIPSQPQLIKAGHPIATVRCEMDRPSQGCQPDQVLAKLRELQSRLLHEFLQVT